MSDVSVDAVEEHVSQVCLHRPPNNFFDTALLGAVADAYEELAETTGCRAIVLRSEGKHFCAGLDFATNKEQDIAALYRNALRIFAAPLPVVAAVQGGAIGGGLGLALSADFRIATPGSRFSANFSRLGFHHGFGRWASSEPPTFSIRAAAWRGERHARSAFATNSLTMTT